MKAADFRLKLKRSERDVQNAILAYLQLRKIPHSVTDATAVLNLSGKRVASKARKGWPDITCILPPKGNALFIECKSSTGRVRPEQNICHEEIRNAGGVVIVARSAYDVERFVDGYLAAYSGKQNKDGKGR